MNPSERNIHIARLRDLAPNISGQGMRGSVRGVELQALLDAHDEAVAAAAKAARSSKKQPAGAAAPVVDCVVLGQVAQILAGIIEASPELWGSTAQDALAAYCASHGIADDVELAAALEAALSGEGAGS